MKIAKRLFLFFALVAAGPLLHAQVKTADSLVQRIFASLKAKDEKAFVGLYPNGQQFSRFMRTVMEGAMKSDQMKEMMSMDTTKKINIDSLIDAQVAMFAQPQMVQQMQTEFAKTFQQVIEKGEKKGVNWNQARLTGFTIDSSSVKGDESMPFDLAGLKEAKGVIDFTVGDSAYQLAFGKMMYIQSEGGWFGAEFPQLARKGESLAPDPAAEEEGAEPAREKTSTKKPAAKSTGKAPAKKAAAKPKAKAQTPARKKPTA
ncbi:MAG: hypothetical protein M3Q06_15275 [Bacteroidota bacterium]|nr:hypothetical protein [Bacteroidota bacterium]